MSQGSGAVLLVHWHFSSFLSALMTENFHSSKTPAHTELFTQLGRLVVAWNWLEQVMRDILYTLSIRDRLTTAILTVDMNATALMRALGTLATEHDTVETIVRKKRERSPDSFTKYLGETLGKKEPQPVFPHVSHFILYCDRLREFRNFYVHGILTPSDNGEAIAATTTARGKLSFYNETISSADLEALTIEIAACSAYGAKVAAAIAQARAYEQKKDAAPPTWPEKPPLPDSMERHRRGLLSE
jgi:hypothetical protein